jgi:hypothetical protein
MSTCISVYVSVSICTACYDMLLVTYCQRDIYMCAFHLKRLIGEALTLPNSSRYLCVVGHHVFLLYQRRIQHRNKVCPLCDTSPDVLGHFGLHRETGEANARKTRETDLVVQ